MRGVGDHLGVDAVLIGFTPGLVFRIGAAGEVAEVRPIRADSHAITETAIGKRRTEAFVDDFDQRRNVLHVVARHAAADGKNTKSL